MFKTTKLASAVKLASVLGVTSVALSAPVYAQQSSDEGAETVEKIQVTGSRIRKTDFVSNAPVATIGVEQFILTNSVNTEALLNTLPQVIPGLDRASNNPGGGIATVDLRGLGANRTLVMVDGVRMIPTTAGGAVDINSIPAALIQDVEVLTGGASAVYGSDAVAGVVNFVLRRDFEGVEANVSFEQTDRGDADIWNAALTMGGNFADGKGNVVFNMTYTERAGVFQGARSTREFAAVESRDAQGRPIGLEPGGSLINNAGVFPVDTRSPLGGQFPSGFMTFDRGGNGATARPFVAAGPENDFYNYAPVNYMQLPQQRHQITALGHYEINENVEVYARGMFMNSTVPQQLAPTPVQLTGGFEFSLAGNPFISPESQVLLNQLYGNGLDHLGNPVAPGQLSAIGRLQNFEGQNSTGFRRFPELGPRIVNDDNQMFQMLTGVRGEIMDSGWTYDVYFQTGRVNQNTEQLGDVNTARIRQAAILARDEVTGEVLLDANGNPSCANTASSGGLGACAPMNIFGEGAVSPEAAAFIATRVNALQQYDQKIIGANFSGDTSDWFELPGGPIGIAFGFERREEDFSFNPSQDLAAGTIAGFNSAPPVAGGFSVSEYYIEAYIPLIEGLEFAELIDLELAYRYADWSTVGSVEAFKVAGSWTINDSVRVRSGFNRAVRAPNIGELFSPQNEGFPSAVDPCSAASGNQNAANADAIRAICVANGVPAGSVFSQGLNLAAGQVRSLSGGNPGLQEETADTFTLGLVLNPIENLSVSVDYFDIQIEGAVAAFGGGAANVLNTCFDPANPVGGTGSQFCNSIQRFDDGTINNVLLFAQNAASIGLRGVDLIVDYGWEMAGGMASINYLGTYTDRSTFQAFAGADVIECAGKFGNVCGQPTPEFSHRMAFQYRTGALNTQLLWRYIGAVNDPDERFYVTDIGSYSYFDFTASYDITEEYRVNVGVRNLFDKEAPIIGNNAQQANSWPGTYDIFGRTFFVGLNARF